MEENSSGKRKLPSLPPNYISISDLKRRWNEEKERKQKEEEEERLRIQEIEEQRRIKEEEDLKKREQKKEPVVSETGDDGLPKKKKKKKKNKGKFRKRYDSRKKKNHDVVAVEECGEEAKGNGPRDDLTVIETEFEDVVPKKKKNIRRHRKKQVQNVVVAVEENVVECGTESKAVKKEEKGEGKGPREEAVMALETECENLSMGRGEIKELKEQTRSGKREKNQDVVAVGESVVECT